MFIPLERSERRSLEILIAFTGKQRDVMCPPVTSFSGHTREARGLKIGMHMFLTWMASNFTTRFLISCLEAEILKFKAKSCFLH